MLRTVARVLGLANLTLIFSLALQRRHVSLPGGGECSLGSKQALGGTGEGRGKSSAIWFKTLGYSKLGARVSGPLSSGCCPSSWDGLEPALIAAAT